MLPSDKPPAKRIGRPPLPPTSTTVLAQVGRLILGREWQRPMARLLGQLHPEGPRETMDPRLIQRWAGGLRRVPEWVVPKLTELLEMRAVELQRQSREAYELAEQLKHHGLAEPPVDPSTLDEYDEY
ncbi:MULTISPECIES: hypothetical protein [Methylobacterium]|uniref:hypothetical protein n=1 Tax=Methylobacterium TaxID=407 RepID=UPI0019106600|nr:MULTISPECIES: hypothetical protein [Methylobacterium]MCI9879585.1 hypothetical protein [Methylobacterium goesingense]